uniref:C3H1-type domain-containing protein n=2 Tax=Lygus hesperus TaxID=30085 RepID=A0A146KY82_LYGHE
MYKGGSSSTTSNSNMPQITSNMPGYAYSSVSHNGEDENNNDMTHNAEIMNTSCTNTVESDVGQDNTSGVATNNSNANTINHEEMVQRKRDAVLMSKSIPTHPCIAQLGSCKYGDYCRHIDRAADVCVFYLNGNCRNETGTCSYRHEPLEEHMNKLRRLRKLQEEANASHIAPQPPTQLSVPSQPQSRGGFHVQSQQMPLSGQSYPANGNNYSMNMANQPMGMGMPSNQP